MGGEPLRVLRMPMPNDQVLRSVNASDGVFRTLLQMRKLKLRPDQSIDLLLASSYMNYIVTNGVVLLPKYARAGTDDVAAEKLDKQAAEAISAAFPGRAVLRINPSAVNA